MMPLPAFVVNVSNCCCYKSTTLLSFLQLHYGIFHANLNASTKLHYISLCRLTAKIPTITVASKTIYVKRTHQHVSHLLDWIQGEKIFVYVYVFNFCILI